MAKLHPFIKMAGFKDEKSFYKAYPSPQAFYQAFPQAQNGVVMDDQLGVYGTPMNLSPETTQNWNATSGISAQNLGQAPIENVQQPSGGGMSTAGASDTAGYIQQGVKAVGDVMDTIGSIRRSILTGAPQLLNALIPETHNTRNSVPQMGYNQYAYGTGSQTMYENGGSIETNPAHKGAFTKKANAAGMSVQAFAKKVIAHPEKYSESTLKQAEFAHNIGGSQKKAQNGTELNDWYRSQFGIDAPILPNGQLGFSQNQPPYGTSTPQTYYNPRYLGALAPTVAAPDFVSGNPSDVDSSLLPVAVPQSQPEVVPVKQKKTGKKVQKKNTPPPKPPYPQGAYSPYPRYEYPQTDTRDDMRVVRDPRFYQPVINVNATPQTEIRQGHFAPMQETPKVDPYAYLNERQRQHDIATGEHTSPIAPTNPSLRELNRELEPYYMMLLGEVPIGGAARVAPEAVETTTPGASNALQRVMTKSREIPTYIEETLPSGQKALPAAKKALYRGVNPKGFISPSGGFFNLQNGGNIVQSTRGGKNVYVDVTTGQVVPMTDADYYASQRGGQTSPSYQISIPTYVSPNVEYTPSQLQNLSQAGVKQDTLTDTGYRDTYGVGWTGNMNQPVNHDTIRMAYNYGDSHYNPNYGGFANGGTLYKEGDVVDLSEQEIKRLKALGYNLEITK